MAEQAEIRKTDLLPVLPDPVDIRQTQTVVRDRDHRAVTVSHGLLCPDAVQNLFDILPVQCQHTGGAPVIEVVQVVDPRIQVMISTGLQMQIVRHKGGRVNRAGTVLTDRGHSAVFMHNHKALPALRQDTRIHQKTHVNISFRTASSSRISASSWSICARISLVGGYSTGIYSIFLYLLMERS